MKLSLCRVMAGMVLLTAAWRSHAQNPNVTLQGVIQGANGLPAANTLINFTPTQTFFVVGTGGPGTGSCTSVGFHTLQMSDGNGGCLTTNSQYNVGSDLSFTFGVATPAGFTANTGDLGFSAHSAGGGIQLLDQSGGVLIRSNTGGVGITTTTGGMALRVTSGGMLLRSDSIDLDATDAVVVSAGGHGLQLDSSGNVVGQDDMFFNAETNRFQFQKGSDFSHPTPHGDFDTHLFTPGDAFVYTMPRATGTLALTSTISSVTAPLCANGPGGDLTDAGCTGGGGGGGPTLQTNASNNTSQALLNFVNPSAFNGLTFTFSNPSGGVETFAVGGTLGNAGLTNPSMTINGTSCILGGSCTVSGGGGTSWSALTNPSTNLALTMGANTTTFTFGATTGTADLMKWTDTASNTGTGIMAHFTTAASSTEIPWQADANGVGWRVKPDGSLASVGSSIAGTFQMGAGTAPGTSPTSTIQVYAPTSVTAYSIVLPGSQPTAGNTFLSCTAANPAVCSWAPTGGGGGTASLVASEESVAFSATPTFSTAVRESTITLTAAITSFTLAAGAAGQEKTLTFCENGTGGFNVTPPANVHGFMSLSGGTETASKCNSQHFTYNSIQTAWIADSAGVLNQ